MILFFLLSGIEHGDEMVVSWADSMPRNGSEVQWGEKSDNLEWQSPGNLRIYSTSKRQQFSYWAVMRNLQPSTRYCKWSLSGRASEFLIILQLFFI